MDIDTFEWLERLENRISSLEDRAAEGAGHVEPPDLSSLVMNVGPAVTGTVKTGSSASTFLEGHFDTLKVNRLASPDFGEEIRFQYGTVIDWTNAKHISPPWDNPTS